MPPRIAYWTSSFEPEMEAIASEVATLRQNFPSSVVWGLSQRRWALASWKRGYCLNQRLHLLFRAATRLLEPLFNLNHVFGSLEDWFYLNGVRRRPLVLTLVTMNPVLEQPTLERVHRFVVEYPSAVDELKRLGVEERRISQIFPPVNLKRFFPQPIPAGPFTALFASSPDRKEWLDARGVPQILNAALLRPNMRFRLLWRPWGDSAEYVSRWITERGLANVELVVRCFDNMADEYNKAHVTLAPFADMIRAKAAPNSLVESVACGRPVVATAAVGLSKFISEAGAGITCEATGEALAESLDRLSADWNSYSSRARRLAETWFSSQKFIEQHQKLYNEVLSR